MSTFLGPIHYWLFNKIRYVEDREEALIQGFTERYGEDVKAIVSSVRERYGMPFDSSDLGELIGDSPIHFWLQEAIRRAETREAALLKGVIERYGEDAKGIAIQIAFEHGRKIGEKALQEGANRGDGTEAIYNLIHNSFLDGMPCDHVTEVETPSSNLLVERHIECLHKDYWDEVGISGEFMCSFLENWIKGLCAADPRIDHKRVRSIARGDSQCEDTFSLKGAA